MSGRQAARRRREACARMRFSLRASLKVPRYHTVLAETTWGDCVLAGRHASVRGAVMSRGTLGPMSLGWNRIAMWGDTLLLFATRFIRLFAYGSLSVVLVLYLTSLGLGESK